MHAAADQVFVWLEEDDDLVEDYRTFEGHREDITHMAAFPDKQVASLLSETSR